MPAPLARLRLSLVIAALWTCGGCSDRDHAMDSDPSSSPPYDAAETPATTLADASAPADRAALELRIDQLGELVRGANGGREVELRRELADAQARLQEGLTAELEELK